MDPAEALLGRTLDGRYRLTAVLGEGGMGVVYEGVDETRGAPVAIKVLHPDVDESAEPARRLEREATVVSHLAHPNIVEVYALGQLADGTLYLVMERVRGRALVSVLEAGPLAPRRALVMARQALEGIGFAHAHGIVHRDLKPDNIMIARVETPDGGYDQVKLLDFGLVKILSDAAIGDVERLTRTGVIFGTPAYIAPEQALGRLVDGRADLYAMGVVIFEMLTGRPPFEAEDTVSLLRKQVGEPAPTLASRVAGAAWCTPQMEALVAGALGKRPEERYADAWAMIAAVDAAFVSIDHVPNA